MEASLYIHVPFCRAKCDYCDFFSLPLQEEKTLDRYIEALLGEIDGILEGGGLPGPQSGTQRPSCPAPLRASPLRGLALPPSTAASFTSVYIGGGTPSILGPERLRSLLAALRPLNPAEITLEANPESTDEALLEAALSGGVSRLSLGVQSFSPEMRRALGRSGLHEKSLALAAEAFGGGLCLDLICGIPGQSPGSLRADIRAALSFKPGHISLYSLTVEEGTPLFRRIERGEVRLPCREAADALYISGRDALEAAGLPQYEVSNFCIPGRESRHNIRYWLMQNWLAAGPGASATIFDDEAGTASRRTCGADLEAYLAKRPAYAWEHIDKSALLMETLMMGFRYRDGPDPALFRKRFGAPLEAMFPASFSAWRSRGLLREDRAALTPSGLLLLNRFLLDCLEEEDPRAEAQRPQRENWRGVSSNDTPKTLPKCSFCQNFLH